MLNAVDLFVRNHCSQPSAVGASPIGVRGPEVIPINRGAHSATKMETTPSKQHRMQRDYASTTDCILQNLSMPVGNPSARCYANAPWRAFRWTCALLQETSTQPSTNIQEAVQESLELAEAVDLHQLPGLQCSG